MKSIILLTALLTAFCPAQKVEKPFVLVPWRPPAKEAPLFFSATAKVRAEISTRGITSTQDLTFHILQGKPRQLTLALAGDGQIVSVTGGPIKDWSVRSAADGTRYLDLRPDLSQDKSVPGEFKVTVATSQPVHDTAALLLPRKGPATSLDLEVTLKTDPTAETRITDIDGLLPVADQGVPRYVGTGNAAIQLSVRSAALAGNGVDLANATLDGTLSADGNSISFTLTATARAATAGAKLQLASGAALASGVSGDGWHLTLRQDGEAMFYDLVADRPGELALKCEWIVPVTHKGDWRSAAFRLCGGVVVPVRMGGMPAAVEFDRNRAVVPEKPDGGNGWVGFLPATGEAALAWRTADTVAGGALFFSSTGTSDIRVGSGGLRQTTRIDLRVLQGRLPGVDIDLSGPGEILAVNGEGVLGWTVSGDGTKRSLTVKLNQPVTATGHLVIESQSPLGAFPVTAHSLLATPRGSLRHSGWLRIANEGAVRIDVMDAKGLVQLAPSQFPGGTDESPRQCYVYRFPAAEHSFAIQADRVTPEVAVTESTTYELAEIDRRITSDIQLDIREAPLRDWEFEIPATYAVASLTGAAVADFSLLPGANAAAPQKVRVIFKNPVAGLQVISLRLEQNLAPKPGPWELPPLGFPGVKSRRGTIGVAATAGYRLAAAKTTGVSEIPAAVFGQAPGAVQQAFRLREEKWGIGLTIEALGQSVQADVFHLYRLKPGAAYAKIMLNYFVVGAPATEWKIEVPKDAGNIEVTGQNAGRDWRREGDTVIVPLSRPLLGAGTLLVSFEQPLDPRAGELSPGGVRPLGVQDERGYILVSSPMQVKYSVAAAEGPLLDVDFSELPAELAMMSVDPALKAWQYTGRPFRIDSRIGWYTLGETAGQMVDFLKLASHVSRDGEWSTDLRAFVKSRTGNVLRATLPPGISLWEVRVAGQPVNARQDGGQTLIPLPPPDTRNAVEVTMRYGARAPSAGHVSLAAPSLGAPVVIGEWTVTGDKNRKLVPAGGNAGLVRPVLRETGFTWLGRHPSIAALLGLLAVLAAALGLSPGGKWRQFAAILCGAAVAIGGVALASRTLHSGPPVARVLEYAAPVVVGSAITLEIDNVAPWQAAMSWSVWLLLLAGAGLFAYGSLRGNRWQRLAGIALCGCALLAIRGGIPAFFIAAAALAALWSLPRLWRFLKTCRPAPVAAATAMLVVMTVMAAPQARAQYLPGHPIPAAESMVHDWQISQGRLRGTVDAVVRGKTGDRFLLLTTPAALNSFTGDGMKIVKLPYTNDATGYYMVLEKDGCFSGRASFGMPLDDPSKGWQMPAGPAAMRRVTLRWDQPGWEFTASGAARTQAVPGLPASASGAVLTLGAGEVVQLRAVPRQRDVAAEETRFFAEVRNLFLPAPGVANGRHLVTVRPARGRVASLLLTVPEGFTVSDVTRGPVDSWRFDPGKRELRVTLSPAQSEPFTLWVDTQRATGDLPADLDLAPLRVAGAAGETGFLAIACGDDSQVESVTTDGLAKISSDDFGTELLPEGPDDHPSVIIQQACRYAAGKASARARIAPVAPELRSETRLLVSLGEDRLLLEADLAVSIARAGVFNLRAEIPAGLEIESATGEGLSHWTESKAGGSHVLTLHLSEKSTGLQRFNVVLSGPSPGASDSWQVPHIRVLDVEKPRDKGILTIVPEQGLQVRAVKRQSVSQLDPRDLFDNAKGASPKAAKPGALAYRLLQGDWTLALAISRLDPWVSARVFHEANFREGQLLATCTIDYQIENAAVKSLRVAIPGLDANAAATVRANGRDVADLVPVTGSPDRWDIRFQHGIIGRTRVELQYQRRSVDTGEESVAPAVLENTRVNTAIAAVRATGRLEIEPGALPRGWERADWSAARTQLDNIATATQPLLCYRLSDPEGPLPVKLRQLDLASLQRLRVASGTLTSLLSPEGRTMTSVDLRIEASAKGPVILTLPPKAEPVNVLVNGEPAALVRVGEGWQFNVFPSPAADRPAGIRFVYIASTASPGNLQGPALAVPGEKENRSVPMENLTWNVIVPEGWTATSHNGDFILNASHRSRSYTLRDYRETESSIARKNAEQSSSLINQAKNWRSEGKNDLAIQALENARRSNWLNEAANEDARVLELNAKTEQIMLGINTRRQRVLLDNRRNLDAEYNMRLDRATAANPIMNGLSGYNAGQLDQQLSANTASENSAIRAIAEKLVAADPVPQALDIVIPERGTVLSFSRSVQVSDPGHPMTLGLGLKPAGRPAILVPALLCLALGTLATGKRRRP